MIWGTSCKQLIINNFSKVNFINLWPDLKGYTTVLLCNSSRMELLFFFEKVLSMKCNVKSKFYLYTYFLIKYSGVSFSYIHQYILTDFFTVQNIEIPWGIPLNTQNPLLYSHQYIFIINFTLFNLNIFRIQLGKNFCS